MEIGSLLLPYQQKWIADDADIKVCEKSRRIGLTWSEALDHALAGSRRTNPQDTHYIAYNSEIAREFIGDVAMWASVLNEAASEVEEFVFDNEGRDIKAFRINYATGKSTIALSSRPTNLRGRQGIVTIDEAAYHEDLPGLLKAAKALKMWGGKIRIISTHNGKDNEFNVLCENIRAGRKGYKNHSLHRIDLDDALADGLYRRICLKLGREYSESAERAWRDELVEEYGDGANEELFCSPSESGTSYFPRLLVERNMSKDIPVLRLTMGAAAALTAEETRRIEVQEWLERTVDPVCQILHPFYKTSYGFDFARSGDLSYLMVFQEQPDLARKAAFALELKNVPFSQQEQILFHVVKRLPRFIAGAHDARGNGQSLAEKAADKFGYFRIYQVMLTNQWYLENFPKYKAAHEDCNVILPACADLLEDHRQVVIDRGVPKPSEAKVKGTNGNTRHADGAIACVLAWFASCREVSGLHAVASCEADGW